MPSAPRRFAALVLAAACITWLGCNVEESGDAIKISIPNGLGTSPAMTAEPAARSGDSIRIASFNIQVFGQSKLKKHLPMDILAKVIRRFDVVAIQEVRAKTDTILPDFIALINAEGARYDFVIGPREGRTSSKEQYAILFDTARIEVDPRSVYAVPDPDDQFQRTPMVARFRVRGPAPNEAFTFSLADIHTEPDEARNEMDALAATFVGIQNNGSGEDDVILLGDLNSDEYHFGRLGQLPRIAHAITGVTTNTRRTHMYDNIIFDRGPTVEYLGRWGVLDLMNEYNLTLDVALEVSDHFPVWAEFSAFEGGPGAVANRPQGVTQ